MQKDIENKRVTLRAESAEDALKLNTTPYTTLRSMYDVSPDKELALDYGKFGYQETISVQRNIPTGGYTVGD